MHTGILPSSEGCTLALTELWQRTLLLSPVHRQLNTGTCDDADETRVWASPDWGSTWSSSVFRLDPGASLWSRNCRRQPPLWPHTDTNTLARVARLLPLEKSTFAHNTGNTPGVPGKPGGKIPTWQRQDCTSEISWRKWLKRSWRDERDEQGLTRFVLT